MTPLKIENYVDIGCYTGSKASKMVNFALPRNPKKVFLAITCDFKGGLKIDTFCSDDSFYEFWTLAIFC